MGSCTLHRLVLAIAACSIALGGCATDDESHSSMHAGLGNPPAAGFDAGQSDAAAIALADRTMAAMGGRKAWDEVRYLTWNFFGRRRHIWDKYTGDVRTEYTDANGQTVVTLININTRQGQTTQKIEDDSQRTEALENAYAAWVNDSYWVFMPYKMKDTGVTLNYLGEGEMQTGDAADILQLTFKNVGVTPQNKYHVWVGKQSGLVEQWSYFSNATDPEPRFTVPWTDWREYGPIKLSTGRGEREITQMAVLSAVPARAFTSTDPIDWNTVMANRWMP